MNILKVSIIMFFISVSVFSQIYVDKPNFEEIYRENSNTKSEYYLPKLMKKFNENDTTLTYEKLRFLYFGYKPNCHESNYSVIRDKYIEKIRIRDNSVGNVNLICDSILNFDRFDIEILYFKNAFNLFEKPNNKELLKEEKVIFNLFLAIISSGKGTEEKPIFLANKEHYMFVIKIMGLKPKSELIQEKEMFFVNLQEGGFLETIYFKIIN